MSKGFYNASDLMKAGLNRVGLQQAVREKSAKVLWAEVVGEKTASVTRIDTIRDGVIFLTCRDSLWAQQLHFLCPMIIQKLNERLGNGVIKDIKLSGVGFRKGQAAQEEKERPFHKHEDAPPLTKEEIAEVEEVASHIPNPDLAEKVLRGLKASKSMTKRTFKFD